MTQETKVQSRISWRKLRADPRAQLVGKALVYGLGGFLVSAFSLAKQPQPMALGLVCALTGWRALAAALGSMLGYRAIWAEEGGQGAVWSLGGCIAALVLGKRRQTRASDWLLPAVGCLVVSLSGLAFQMFAEDVTAVPIYWARVFIGGASTKLFQKLLAAWGAGEEVLPRKGELATVQVRLEIMAGVLSQTQQLLLEAPAGVIDEDAILARTRERACGGCPNRKGCTETLPRDLLHKSLADTASLGIGCKKPNRLMLELRRSQEQLRLLRSGDSRRQECREAVIQQYRFLSGYLRQTADGLTAVQDRIRLFYKAEVQIVTLGKETANGDKCQAFSGPGGRYYVLLCDGMGTGMGAAQEGQSAMALLRQMLTAGFPGEYALESLNSLCCLRGRAGAATVDLAEICLDTGKVMLYKWGAAPSLLIRNGGGEKIGTAGPPPGLSVETSLERVDRLSLRRGEVLILLSDGVDGEAALRCAWIAPGEPLGEYAAKLLEVCSGEKEDDATVAAIRLHPTSLYT